ncbi:lecithin retinol acyltransferase-like [Perca flavescens]|uniref:lecithin retinol acyltransferase-like n=1 Tax=Perca flavescens TaxID=8167 RepID=UPI00106EF226|nr:lecithin retinol acyltransferase-like [Perca flavescens]
MRKLILVAVILQLVITVDINGFQFGDIISFKPKSCKGISYQHYAVYVGNRTLPGKEDGQNIFERINKKPSCVFSTLDMTEEPEVFNYLDGYKDKKGKEWKAGTEAEMTARINERKANCWPYNLLLNNCEHLATYVRYGVRVALQYNMTGETHSINNPFRISAKDAVKYIRENEGWLNNGAGLQVFPQLTLSVCLALFCIFLM